MEETKANVRQEIYTERVRAGKRTYFFDVKATRSNDYYLTITESKRRYKEDGFTYEKHKIFLYKEDFDKFANALNITINHVKEELLPDVDFSQFDQGKQGDNKFQKSNSKPESGTEAKEKNQSGDGKDSKEDEKAKNETKDDSGEDKTEAGIDNELKWE